MEKKIKPKKTHTKKWIVEMNYYDNGSYEIIRTNKGFTPYELLGISFKAQMEILDQINGKITPTITKRIVK